MEPQVFACKVLLSGTFVGYISTSHSLFWWFIGKGCVISTLAVTGQLLGDCPLGLLVRSFACLSVPYMLLSVPRNAAERQPAILPLDPTSTIRRNR